MKIKQKAELCYANGQSLFNQRCERSHAKNEEKHREIRVKCQK